MLIVNCGETGTCSDTGISVCEWTCVDVCGILDTEMTFNFAVLKPTGCKFCNILVLHCNNKICKIYKYLLEFLYQVVDCS